MDQEISETVAKPKRQTFKQKVESAVIACMDRRLNEKLRSRADGRTIFLRNAGANVSGLAKSIKKAVKTYPNLRSLTVMVHTDCGGMKTVFAAMQGKDFGKDVTKSLVKPFKVATKHNIIQFSTREELERVNSDFQKRALEEIIAKAAPGSSIVVNVESVELQPAEHPVVEPVVVLALPSVTDMNKISGMVGRDINGFYVLNAFNFKEVLPDMAIAKTLELHSIKMIGKSEKPFANITGKIPEGMSAEFSKLA